MLKIKTIEYIKVVYDDSLSHNIFSIANITFSNYEPIYGALLYWQKNKNKEKFTEQGDYKFYYDMSNIQYFAAVKFPKYVRLTRDQKQELSYILLEERGSVGSYSFTTKTSNQNVYNFKKEYEQLHFPKDFDVQFLPPYVKSVVSQIDLNYIKQKYPSYEDKFIQDYAKWRFKAALLHPELLKNFMDKIDFRFLCAVNPYLSEHFLIEHIDQIHFEMLASNYEVLLRLSTPFRHYLYEQLDEQTAQELKEFLDQEEEYEEEAYNSMNNTDEEDNPIEFEFFEYDKGNYKWPGSEHLIKGIPSFAAMQYDDLGYKRRTVREMNQITKEFSLTQWKLFSAVGELYWIHRYKDKIDWSIFCEFNEEITEEFIVAHIKYIDFDALGKNVEVSLSESFLDRYMNKFNHKEPQPLIVRNLTAYLYSTHKHTININQAILHEYSHLLERETLQELQNIVEP